MLYVKPYVYSVTDAGVVTCFNSKNGELVWQERVGGKHSSSPVYADGKIYLLTEAEGETIILEAGPKFKELGRNRLDEICKASMAISNGRLFIRTEHNLICIGE